MLSLQLEGTIEMFDFETTVIVPTNTKPVEAIEYGTLDAAPPRHGALPAVFDHCLAAGRDRVGLRGDNYA